MENYLLITIIIFLYSVATYSSSQYKGVIWNKNHKKWRVTVCWNKKKFAGGEHFDELDAAKQVNQLCDDLGITRKNPGVGAMRIVKIENCSSQYKGVSWGVDSNKWLAAVTWKNKRYHGGLYGIEQDAAKRVNQICDELGIERKNPNVCTQSNLKITYETSIYKCVGSTADKKWSACVCWNKATYQGGHFSSALDAAKRVNKLCDDLGIERKNPGVNAMPNADISKKKTSLYKGVCWMKDRERWKAYINLKDQKKGSYFVHELDAARRVNKWCDEFGIKRKNIDVNSTKNEKEKLLNYDAISAELEDFIKMLGGNNDLATLTMKETLKASINYRGKNTNTKINLQTKDCESALSIAAKHGFSHIVKFLISKGTNKEYFTKEHHTPLSLAVSYNHLKIVEILFEKWISPNSHEKPYLHLLPIFNVKSREIAQILVDNDAMTSGLYNGKNQSPLTVACQNGFLDVVEFFLDDGLDIDHLDNDNKTPLFYARTNNHHDVVNLLISKGAHD